MKIEAKNITAKQLTYHARGNPPGAHPSTAVGNFFPGLEFNFLSVWKRFFIGIELNESSGDVMGADADAPPEVRQLVGQIMVAFNVQRDTTGAVTDFTPVHVPAVGPTAVGADDENLATIALEWGNLLARLHHTLGGTGQTTLCAFQHATSDAITLVPLAVRRLFDAGTGVISREAVFVGELTQSLCSPWQTDFIGCACYYWAANRPDYVNVWNEVNGTHGGGHNWLDPTRSTAPDSTGAAKPFYSIEPDKTLEHEDIMRSQDWEKRLRFVVGGKDEGSPAP